MIYFTADEHYYHKNIIRFMKRPFKDCDEMADVLVQRHNEIVGRTDKVYHLGDFAFAHAAEVLSRLNGEHHLILGNHDQKRKSQLTGFASIQEVLYLRWENRRFFLSHYAHRVWRSSNRGSFHIYGHSHGMLPKWPRSMDVGVDVHDFRPLSAIKVVESLQHDNFMNQHPEAE